MFVIDKLIQKNIPRLLYLLVIIIAVLTIVPIFSHSYFSMHDDQHVARLYLLDQAINQGTLYPRWVDQLGFGYGYPLFNFYPPLIYYVAEIFRSVGFGYMTSIKLMLLVATIVGSLGMYVFLKKIYNSTTALVGAIFFTFFGYRAIALYVRGAFSEYMGLSLVPWVLWSLHRLKKDISIKNAFYVGISSALLILAHPFIAVPASFFIVVFTIMEYLSLRNADRPTYMQHVVFGGLLGLGLSAFFWLPSMIERQYTLIDSILLKELASYTIHFVYPQQLWYSPWGFGGSVEGLGDGLSFQIQKPFIGFFLIALLISVNFFFSRLYTRFDAERKNITLYFLLMTLASVFFMLPFSKPIWDAIPYLQYLQFPWRFMAFTGFFLAAFCSSGFYFFSKIPFIAEHSHRKYITTGTIMAIFFAIFIVQGKYFRPQKFLETTDIVRTNFKEIAWRISSTSFEFVPKGVRTTKSAYDTTTLAIQEPDISDKAYTVIEGDATIELLSRRYDYKKLRVSAGTPITLQLNNYSFPGWHAYINGEEMSINDNNDFKLIQIDVPIGINLVEFKFLQTPVRSTAGAISLVSWLYVISALYLSLGSSSSRKKTE